MEKLRLTYEFEAEAVVWVENFPALDAWAAETFGPKSRGLVLSLARVDRAEASPSEEPSAAPNTSGPSREGSQPHLR